MTLFELLDNYYREVNANTQSPNDGILTATVRAVWPNSLPITVDLFIAGTEFAGNYQPFKEFQRPVGIAHIDRKTTQITRLSPARDVLKLDWDRIMRAFEAPAKEGTAA